MSRTSAIAMATVLTDADVAVAPRVRRSRAVVSGQDRCATITARSAITLSVLERVETCPCLSPERARVSLNRMEIDDMPTRLAHDMDFGVSSCRYGPRPVARSFRAPSPSHSWQPLHPVPERNRRPRSYSRKTTTSLRVNNNAIAAVQFRPPRPRAGFPDADAPSRAGVADSTAPTAPPCPP